MNMDSTRNGYYFFNGKNFDKCRDKEHVGETEDREYPTISIEQFREWFDNDYKKQITEQFPIY